MATYVHGKNAAFLFGGARLSPWIREVTTSQTTEVADTSHFEQTAKTYIVGQHDGTISFGGLYDSTAGAIQDVLTDTLTTDIGVPTTFAPEGTKVGATAVMAISKQTSYEVSTVVSDVEQVSGEIQVDGGIRYGVMLTEAPAITGTTNFATYDQGSTLAGNAVAYLHVTQNVNSGALTATIQHSADGAVWADHTVFDLVPAGQVASSVKTLIGPINRYVRLRAVPGGVGEVSLAATFSR